MTDRQKQRVEHADEPVVGRDLPRSERPGVPMEYEPPHPLTPMVRWNEPERMQPVPGVTKRVELDRLTPVFSTALRPSGLSGVIRRIAYSIPESHAKHWATLMLADRVDVLEHRIAKLLKFMVLVPAGTAAAVLIVAKVARQFR
jgi:hypothetical protein